MTKGIFEEFDGYDEVKASLVESRKQGVNYTRDKDMADQYIDRLHPRRLQLRLTDVISETPDAKTLRLVSTDGYLPPFLAGQYVALFVETGGIRTSRPYSISSPPNQIGYYDLTVRRVENGLVSNYLLDEVRVGDVLESSGPAGQFYHNPLFHDRAMVCLAGGSGVTPFMSMIREIAQCGLDRTVYLFYGNRSIHEAAFHDELTTLATRFPNIRYFPVVENPLEDRQCLTGYISADIVSGHIDGLNDKTFYMCGPQAMYDFCRPELEALGVPRRKIRQEMYGPPLAVWEDPAWPRGLDAGQTFTVRVRGGSEVKVKAGEPLLNALERAGMVIPSLCRSGECSLCRVKLESGRVFQPAGTLVRKSDRQFGYIHSCASFPLEDLEIQL